MRLLLVTRGFPPKGRWGSEGYSHDLACGLAARGHTVEVLFRTYGAAERVETRTSDRGIAVHEHVLPVRFAKPFRDSYQDSRQDRLLARLLRDRGPFDRVHFTALGGGVSFGQIPVARQNVREILVTLTEFLPFCHRGNFLDDTLADCTRGPDPVLCSRCVMQPLPWEAGGFRQKLKAAIARLVSPAGPAVPLPTPRAFAMRQRYIEKALEQVDLLIAPSDGLADRYVELGIAEERIARIPYALDPRRYEGYAPTPSARVRFAFTGQIAPHKGVHTLVDAVAQLPPATRDAFELVLHGSPPGNQFAPFEAMLRDKVAGLPIAMPGPFPPDAVARVLGEADIVVLPSQWLENMPLALMNARACGLPVLASRVGGIETFVADGVDGVLVPAREPAAWAEAMRRIVEDRDWFDALRRGAGAAALPQSFPAHLDRLEGVFGPA